MTIEVKSRDYFVFYEHFKNAFIQREMGGSSIYGRGNDSPKIWEYKLKGAKKERALEIFGNGTKDCQYFYRMKVLLSKKATGKINAAALIGAFKYLGFHLLPPEKYNGLLPQEKAKILFDTFKNHVIFHSTIEEFDMLHPADVNSVSIDQEFENDSLNNQVLLTVRKFLLSFTKSSFDRSFYLLSLDQREKVWLYDYKKFESFHAHLRNARNIHVFDFRRVNESKIDCKVYVEVLREVIPLYELDRLQKMTINEMGELVNKIEDVRKALNVSKSEFKKVLLHKLLGVDGQAYLFEELNLKYHSYNRSRINVSEEVEPAFKLETRIYQCTCIPQNNGTWLIDNFAKLP